MRSLAKDACLVLKSAELADSKSQLTVSARFFSCLLESDMGESYRPLLASLPERLYKTGPWPPLERGTQLSSTRESLSALTLMICSVFDTSDLALQPKYICHMGCGDGALLVLLYEYVRDCTVRGKHLDRFPLLMIGADSEMTLRSENLGVPCRLVLGDVSDPLALLRALKAECGVQDANSVLHVRCFLDHQREYVAPRTAADSSAVAEDGAFIARDGSSLSAALVVQNLEEHLGRWSLVLEGNSHGLFILEVHNMGVGMTRKLGSESESLHFDMMQSLSGRLLVQPPTFLSCAARVGLFSQDATVFPDPPNTRVTAHRFVRAPYSIRQVVSSDMGALQALEHGSTIFHESIAQRIARSPSGQFALIYEGQPIASAFSQPVTSLAALKEAPSLTLETLTSHLDHSGSCLQLIGAFLNPDFGQWEPAHALLVFVLKLACLSGYECVAAVTRWSGFARWKVQAQAPSGDTSWETYHSAQIDPTVNWHRNRGARVERLVPHFNPRDLDNEAVGVLISYHFDPVTKLEIARQTPLASTVSALHTPSAGANSALTAIREIAAQLSGKQASQISAADSFVDIGLDSLHLAEMRQMLEARLGMKRASSPIFFTYPTVGALANYFQPSQRSLLLTADAVADILAASAPSALVESGASSGSSPSLPKSESHATLKPLRRSSPHSNPQDAPYVTTSAASVRALARSLSHSQDMILNVSELSDKNTLEDWQRMLDSSSTSVTPLSSQPGSPAASPQLSCLPRRAGSPTSGSPMMGRSVNRTSSSPLSPNPSGPPSALRGVHSSTALSAGQLSSPALPRSLHSVRSLTSLSAAQQGGSAVTSPSLPRSLHSVRSSTSLTSLSAEQDSPSLPRSLHSVRSSTSLSAEQQGGSAVFPPSMPRRQILGASSLPLGSGGSGANSPALSRRAMLVPVPLAGVQAGLARSTSDASTLKLSQGGSGAVSDESLGSIAFDKRAWRGSIMHETPPLDAAPQQDELDRPLSLVRTAHRAGSGVVSDESPQGSLAFDKRAWRGSIMHETPPLDAAPPQDELACSPSPVGPAPVAAIRGFSLCVSLAESESRLFQMLRDGGDLVRDAPSERPELQDVGFQGGFLSASDVWTFDHSFWLIPARGQADGSTAAPAAAPLLVGSGGCPCCSCFAGWIEEHRRFHWPLECGFPRFKS